MVNNLQEPHRSDKNTDPFKPSKIHSQYEPSPRSTTVQYKYLIFSLGEESSSLSCNVCIHLRLAGRFVANEMMGKVKGDKRNLP